VYGPHQALSNPYTGVMAIFASRLLNDRRPMIFEDGRQRRDFVSVHDVAQACALSLVSDDAVGNVFNIGSGRSLSVEEVSNLLARTLDKEHLRADVTGKYRIGDIRHCFADITAAQRLLGYRPQVGIEDGIAELAEWLQDQVANDDVERATQELEMRGLTV
jgi:dTDP-L-rhamnose 4-epimerase